jgi:hypothetical protein
MSPAKEGDHGQIGDLLLAHDDLTHTGGNGIADAFDSGISHKTYFLLVCLLQYTIGGKEMQEESFGAVQPPQAADAASSPFQGQPMLPWLK